MIPETVIENVRSQTNVLDVISAFVHLKKSGNNYFGLCPFQAEKNTFFFSIGRQTNFSLL
ncbi:CHC2 zinc finger domain-containing protein [Apilactobacillus ozensis]|uniref:CHC2 zinc finger domain-containing protein n=1 Tax=Apilactobacillus ozensis TaxID=866801 RepID=UPI002093ABDD|nr:CHC2 zinc finger domain-containing protein [Apilactobacillus ozensis]